MTTFLLAVGIVLSALTPTIAILVSRFLDHQERQSVARRVKQVAIDAKSNAETTTAKLDEIHILVNSRLTQALERIAGLEDALNIGRNAPIPGEESAK